MAKENDLLAKLGVDAALWSVALGAKLAELIAATGSMVGTEAETILKGEPGGDLFGWVANMIEAGRSAGYAEGQADLSNVVNLFTPPDDGSVRVVFVGGPGKGKDVTAKALTSVLDWHEIVSEHFVSGKDTEPATMMIHFDKGDHAHLAEFSVSEVDAEGFRRGTADACQIIDKRELPTAAVIDSLDATEWARGIEPGRYNVTGSALAAWFALAIEAGRRANKVRGLNSDDDGLAFDVPEVNAIEFILNGDQGGKVWVNVDGRCRMRIGRTTTVIVEHGGNREVLRRPADAEAAVEDATKGEPAA